MAFARWPRHQYPIHAGQMHRRASQQWLEVFAAQRVQVVWLPEWRREHENMLFIFRTCGESRFNLLATMPTEHRRQHIRRRYKPLRPGLRRRQYPTVTGAALFIGRFDPHQRTPNV